MAVRRFNGTSDFINLAPGSAWNNRAWTHAYLVRQSRLYDSMVYQWHTSTSSGVGYGSECSPSNNGAVSLYNGGSNVYSNAGWLELNEWKLCVATKASGTLPVKHYAYDFGASSWGTPMTTAAVADSSSTTSNAFLGVGHYAYGYWFQGDIAALAMWHYQLSDAEVFSLASATSLTAWRTIGPPRGLWLFNQAAVTTAVTDLMTGSGEYATRSRSGTTVVNEEPPIPYVDPPVTYRQVNLNVGGVWTAYPYFVYSGGRWVQVRA